MKIDTAINALRRMAAQSDIKEEKVPMTFAADVLDGIKGLHFAYIDGDGVERCNCCGLKFVWPCPTTIVLNWELEVQ